jgi:hypothetical protein
MCCLCCCDEYCGLPLSTALALEIASAYILSHALPFLKFSSWLHLLDPSTYFSSITACCTYISSHFNRLLMQTQVFPLLSYICCRSHILFVSMLV